MSANYALSPGVLDYPGHRAWADAVVLAAPCPLCGAEKEWRCTATSWPWPEHEDVPVYYRRPHVARQELAGIEMWDDEDDELPDIAEPRWVRLNPARH